MSIMPGRGRHWNGEQTLTKRGTLMGVKEKRETLFSDGFLGCGLDFETLDPTAQASSPRVGEVRHCHM